MGFSVSAAKRKSRWEFSQAISRAGTEMSLLAWVLRFFQRRSQGRENLRITTALRDIFYACSVPRLPSAEMKQTSTLTRSSKIPELHQESTDLNHMKVRLETEITGAGKIDYAFRINKFVTHEFIYSASECKHMAQEPGSTGVQMDVLKERRRGLLDSAVKGSYVTDHLCGEESPTPSAAHTLMKGRYPKEGFFGTTIVLQHFLQRHHHHDPGPTDVQDPARLFQGTSMLKAVNTSAERSETCNPLTAHGGRTLQSERSGPH